MFNKILIANRGEIACRVIKSARRMGIATVAVYSDADRDALHVKMADEAVHIGPAQAAQSYLVIDRILDAIRTTGCEAVHPGYGFLSENAAFADALAKAGVAFIGPPVGAIQAMGDKIESKKLARKAGVSTVPGYLGVIASADEAKPIAREIGYPVMIKASAGGGGKGMRIAWSDDDVDEGFEASMNEARASFGDDRVFIEKFVTSPRHIEIQILGDSHGSVVYLGERECSIQRRNQKVIEEAPSPFLDPDTRKAMGEQAVALAKAVDYCSAGTVEFIVDDQRNFYFLEMNTRLQVEHPVTELITGIDLVEQMIKVADGEALSFGQDDVTLNGWAIESRLYAEDPYRNFLPSTGRLTRYRPPQEEASDMRAIRNDTGVAEGREISIHYDPMIAKLCSWAPDRDAAIAVMRDALDRFELEGIGHNLPFLSAVMDHPRFVEGAISTAFIEEEYPDGFDGAGLSGEVLGHLALGLVRIHMIVVEREAKISGTLANHQRRIGSDWVASLGGTQYRASVDGGMITLDDAKPEWVATDWLPGCALAELEIGGDHHRSVKVDLITGGYRLRYRGCELKAWVRTPRAAELSALMPIKAPPDMSKFLLCPMPGLLTKINAAVGDTVQAGQGLVTVEAMKMENILRAERKAVVKAVRAEVGQSLAVDEVIIEFE